MCAFLVLTFQFNDVFQKKTFYNNNNNKDSFSKRIESKHYINFLDLIISQVRVYVCTHTHARANTITHIPHKYLHMCKKLQRLRSSNAEI